MDGEFVAIVFLVVLVVAALLFLQYIIAKEFYKVAVSKGHPEKKYLWYCFFLGIPGYLLVIALTFNRATSSNPNVGQFGQPTQLPPL